MAGLDVIETQVEFLPDDMKSFIALNTAEQENILQCYLHKQTDILGKVRHGVVALTNQRLLLKHWKPEYGFQFFRRTQRDFHFADSHREPQCIIRLSSIREVDWFKIWPMSPHVYVDYGVIDKKGERAGAGIGFNNEAQAEEFSKLLKKVVAEYSVAPVPVKPVSQATDVADQLTKLAELRRNNMITDEEYQIAKRKLLS